MPVNHKPLTFYLVSALVGIVLLCSCNAGSKFASSFGKRRYMRGYYVDMPVHNVAIGETKTAVVSRADNHARAIPNQAIALSATNANKPVVIIEKRAIQGNALKPATTHAKANMLKSIAATVDNDEGGGGRHKPDSAVVKDNSGLGLGGFICVVLGLLSVFPGAFLLGEISILLFLVLYIIGFVLCIISVTRHDSQYKFAIAGLAIILISIALLFATGGNLSF